ncbi:MAG TPA: DUF2933 domain-containing protein [Acidimicrobiales bacterium]|nr:DUF2933 domain-containing protein [Acidimicrobiales bacterium]
MPAETSEGQEHTVNHQQMIKPMLIGLALFAALGLAGLPVLDYVPLLLVVACPVMMLLMMRGMAGHAEGDGRGDHTRAGRDRRDEP